MRHRTSGPYARAAFGSSMAAATQRTAGSAAFTAASRSAVKVAIPQRLGTAEATKAIRIRPFCIDSASLFGNVIARERNPGWIAPELSSRKCASGGLPLRRNLEVRVLPCGESSAHVGDVVSGRLEDACREARADPAGAVGHDRAIGRELFRAFANFLVGDVDRAGRVPHIPFGVFAHVEEERALVSARGRRSSVELLDPQSLLARGGIGRGVAPYIV